MVYVIKCLSKSFLNKKNIIFRGLKSVNTAFDSLYLEIGLRIEKKIARLVVLKYRSKQKCKILEKFYG